MSQNRPRTRAKQDFLPHDLAAIVGALESYLDWRGDDGRSPCDARCGVYAFFDYDGEPIYVGQTKEQLRVRIRRHITNQRTDAVAMHVLDPLEVSEIEVWPLWDLIGPDMSSVLNTAEFTVYSKLISESPIGKILNEKVPAATPLIDLPPSHRGSIVPDALKARLGHADLRIARRAATIANLSAVIRERDVSLGLRQTLVVQAQRLERLARDRFSEVRGELPVDEVTEETTETGEE